MKVMKGKGKIKRITRKSEKKLQRSEREETAKSQSNFKCLETKDIKKGIK